MKSRPNIMILQAEDTGRHQRCYGDTTIATPHLDQLAEEGCRYTNGFSHAPVCAPSRGGLVTGRYPYSLGNHHMRSTLAHPPRTFTQELRDAGYFVNWNTKLDFNFDPQEGWRDQASAWHEEPAPDQPFLVYENFAITHESRMFPETPAWHGDLPPEAEGIAPPDPRDVVVPPHLTDCPEVREQLVKYYWALAVQDAQVGSRLQWLDDQGLRENTLVIYISDHGRGLPREKRWCYDAGVHLPLIIRWPGGLEPGSVRHDLIAWVDVAPSLLSVAGAPIPEDYQGQIFIGDRTASPRECVFGGRDRMDGVFDCVRFARDKRWHYIRNDFPALPWAQSQKYMEQQEIMGVMREQWKNGELSGDQKAFFHDRKPPEELYDIEKDPNCMNNLAEDPAFEKPLASMRRELDLHRKAVTDLSSVTEENLVEQDILTNRLPEYRERYQQLPDEYIIGPDPIPMTLREAKEAGLDRS